jgi:hypothetical protein
MMEDKSFPLLLHYKVDAISPVRRTLSEERKKGFSFFWDGLTPPKGKKIHARPITLFADKTVHIQPSIFYVWSTALFEKIK